MSKIVVFENLTLDGVMQAPARPDEDQRGGFRYGGWAIPYVDPAMARMAAEGKSGALLLGRRTYEDFYAVWPGRTDNPFTERLNSARKYVASTTLKEPLAWNNSILLKGNVPEAVVELKAQLAADILVLGSGELVRTLIQHDLVDRYQLLIHPLVLGSGQRLFDDDGIFAALRLIDTRTTTTGVVIVTYQRQRSD